LVEDNRDAAQMLAMLLEFAGHRVVVAYNGQQALQQAVQHRFDAAILDIGLPDTDGYTLARQFRAMPQYAAARLVALTGYGSAEDKAKALEAGFDEHIVKPIADCVRLSAALQPSAQRVSTESNASSMLSQS
jgi:CheY-like chemotaxis protein